MDLNTTQLLKTLYCKIAFIKNANFLYSGNSETKNASDDPTNSSLEVLRRITPP